jgi:hypothetical protein
MGNPAAGVRQIVVAMALLLLAACGGGSAGSSGSNASGGSTSSSSGGTTPLSNFTAVLVDAGPAALNVGANGYTATNTPYVTITVCAPGSSTNCQTIDHVLLDTGSVGLRLEASVLNAGLLSALTSETDASSNPVGECYEFVDDYVFGSVKVGDFSIGGESVASMPMQLIGDPGGAFATAPTSCSSSGGSNMNTVQLLGANGLIGVGTTTTDCGSYCTTTNAVSGSIYYDCPASGCQNIVARAASTAAPFQQLPNPVAAFAVDNNGTIMELPSVPTAGALDPSGGMIYFGIDTQTNNSLGSATVLPTDQNGLITATYNGTSFPESFLDSGSTYYYWVDNNITECSQSGYTGFYCPASPLSLAPTLTGYRSGSASAAFTLYNAYTQFAGNVTALPGVGGNPITLGFPNPLPGSFDFGLPFFFGRHVYTAIDGRAAGSATGPYFAY